ncbi:hypothetical protein HanHA300_Chr13g0464771 [Helianthus annuus]|nr:hypothetical protein HanHA300_Chr13g0464771 [Helianthus annuus]KAJ0496181.1 hypothetical protein HanHA89_Chr13g0496791 [Helianthus annuus]KAJ0662255.1 hypothetical protein HanLR1_Chr13g0467371 [Helianthus annuus]
MFKVITILQCLSKDHALFLWCTSSSPILAFVNLSHRSWLIAFCVVHVHDLILATKTLSNDKSYQGLISLCVKHVMMCVQALVPHVLFCEDVLPSYH